MDQDKDREIAHQLPSWPKQFNLQKINLSYWQLKIE